MGSPPVVAAAWLAAAFPAVLRWLGPVAFAALAGRFLSRPGAEWARSDAFPSFLAAEGLASDLPFLPDLALLEARLAEARLLPPPRPLTWSELSALGPQRLSALRVRLRPDATVLRSPWPLCLLRASAAAVEAGASLRPILARRQGDELRCEPLDDDDGDLLELLADGASLMEAQERLAGSGREGLVKVVVRFRRLVERGLLVSAGTEPAGSQAG